MNRHAGSQQDTPKVAVVHDWLNVVGGAERVLEQILHVFPDADVHALIDTLPADQRSFLGGRPVKVSMIGRTPWLRHRHKLALPLMPTAIESFDLSAYDLVISSSFAVAKGAITRPDALHVCYCHSPMRYLWDLEHSYRRDAGLDRGLRGLLTSLLFNQLRMWDVASASRPQLLLANSNFTASRIARYWGRTSTLLPPPVDLTRFSLRDGPGDDDYLTVSRLVPYKRHDLMVEAFAAMPDRRLTIIGDGPQRAALERRATPNVRFLGALPDREVAEHMRRARAFVFAAHEDFGIVPVEAQACGTPVIAYGRGGSLETVRGRGDPRRRTGLFFDAQTVEAIVDAVESFEALPEPIRPEVCRAHAERFAPEQFRARFARAVEAAWAEFHGEVETPEPVVVPATTTTAATATTPATTSAMPAPPPIPAPEPSPAPMSAPVPPPVPTPTPVRVKVMPRPSVIPPAAAPVPTAAALASLPVLTVKAVEPPPAVAPPAAAAPAASVTATAPRSPIEAAPAGPGGMRPIGEIIRAVRPLTDSDVAHILVVQRRMNVRFGEAAVALDLVSQADVLWALSQQFNYPYALDGQGPHKTALIAATDPYSPQAEAFRDLRSRILASDAAGERTPLAVVSPDAGDGRTYVAANLAVAFSQLGERTLLVDGNLRAPALHHLFGLRERPSLADLLNGRRPAKPFDRSADIPGLSVMQVGAPPPNPLELLQQPLFSVLLRELQREFDRVIVDTPPARLCADARVIAATCGQAVLVGRNGSTEARTMNLLVDRLRRTQAEIAGVVLTTH